MISQKIASMASSLTNSRQAADGAGVEGKAGELPGEEESADVTSKTAEENSTAVQQSHPRHHQRTKSSHREVKETLNARSQYTNSQDDGKSQHHINQYIIMEEIGRGSFGAVHLAMDQFGQEYAVKEFSKSRLRKRAQSNILRRPYAARRPGHLAAGGGLNAPLHRHSASNVHLDESDGNPLYLIREEIAIMKKLDHPNLVSLIEVLDDPDEDSLYMVLEMCKKGVVMKVGLDEKADPYKPESCRCWFRDLILGIEYLHTQGVVHRDIKPDNLLLTDDDVLKVVDFGVSEMFEKASEMLTAKSAGSPAFLPPELCIAKHGDISGKAADIWSMGISLYCLRFGKIPFEREGVLELYEAIKNDNIDITLDDDPQFVDLMTKLLEKDPEKRINMKALRDHPWVTKNGKDPLLSEEENTANLVEPPTETEMNHAITGNMKNLLVVMKAVNKFKRLLWKKRPDLMESLFGTGGRVVGSPETIHSEKYASPHHAKGIHLSEKRAVEEALLAEGVPESEVTKKLNTHNPPTNRPDKIVTDVPSSGCSEGRDGHSEPPGSSGSGAKRTPAPTPSSASAATERNPAMPLLHKGDSAGSDGTRGHAHDPMDEKPPFLRIGTGGLDGPSTSTTRAASSSAGAADDNPNDSDNHNDINDDDDDDDDDDESRLATPPPRDDVAESPSAADFNIYDTAYSNEVARIRAAQGHSATVYLTRRVDGKKAYRADENMRGVPHPETQKEEAASSTTAAAAAAAAGGKGQQLPREGWHAMIDRARERSKRLEGKSDAEAADAADEEAAAGEGGGDAPSGGGGGDGDDARPDVETSGGKGKSLREIAAQAAKAAGDGATRLGGKGRLAMDRITGRRSDQSPQ